MARSDSKAEVQHYVPKFLLRGFLREPRSRNQVFVFDKHEDRSFSTNIKNVAAERGFYDFAFDNKQPNFESSLAELEGATSSTFETLIKEESLAALDDQQKSWLTIFIVTQQLRTRHFREVIKALNEAISNHITGLGFDATETEGFKPIETEDDLKLESLAHLVESIGPYSKILSTKACFLMKTSRDQPFWISDQPVVMHNDRQFGPYGNIGLAVPGIQIYLPLTATLLLAFWCVTNANNIHENVEEAKRKHQELSVMRVLGRNVNRDTIEHLLIRYQAIIEGGESLIEALLKGSSVAATDENVTFYNHLQVRWSHRFVISPVNDFTLAKKMISDDSKYRRGFMPKTG